MKSLYSTKEEFTLLKLQYQQKLETIEEINKK